MPVETTALPRLGAHLLRDGVEFSLFSSTARQVELCLFDRLESRRESERVSLEPSEYGVWSVFVPGISPGQLYAYRVDGPFRPERALRFDSSKLLADPYARALTGEPLQDSSLTRFGVDSAPYAPRCLVTDPTFDWQDAEPPHTPWTETVIYECHVRGLTRLHPLVPAELRGTYMGLAQEPVVDHLHRLGVTAVQLMPVHQIASEPHLMRSGRRNYFGYSPLGYFAPHAGYATGSLGQQVVEFKKMVRRLHLAGLEVLLDVVFNHTAEGGPDGPTLSYRGIDNSSYYLLDPADPGRYEDLTGCGNTLNVGHPKVADLILDCMRYWVREMHVDGFRFDLAPVLGRQERAFDPHAAFFERLRSDRLLSRVKLIAEPWDLGTEGYRLGQFPRGWSEWNDRYRDAVRSFWRADTGRLADLADTFGGSPRIFAQSGRGAEASINFVTCHDGFTLQDLVSYASKHNELNGENNRDGAENNLSSNWGIEGPTTDQKILAKRDTIRKSLLATLALSRGVPMLSHGDEIGRTQSGNNNAYCHDSELTWVNWDLQPRDRELLELARKVFALRRRYPSLSQQTSRLRYLAPDGDEMTRADWDGNRTGMLGLLVERPSELVFLVLNADHQGHLFRLPRPTRRGRWQLRLDTARGGQRPIRGRAVRVAPHALMLLEFVAEGDLSHARMPFKRARSSDDT